MLKYTAAGIWMFVNGAKVDSDTSGLGTSRSTGDGRIVVGRSYTDQDKLYASVQVDDMIYFNQALINEDINKLYTAA